MLVSRTIDKLLEKWAAENTPTEVRLIQALETIGRMHEYCLQLEQKIHNQRVANRETWEIVEMRRKWLGSDSARKMYSRLLKRHQKLLAQLRQIEMSKSE